MLPRSTLGRPAQRFLGQSPQYVIHRRFRSTKSHYHDAAPEPAIRPPVQISPMARLPTRFLLRSLLLTSLMTSKIFLRPALALISVLSTSKSALLNPDRNIALNKLLRWTVYNHFCAGANKKEVSRTVADVKKIGYQGVILGYSKEIVLDHNEQAASTESSTTQYQERCYEMIEEWKNGTLETLRMVGPGDFLAVKYANSPSANSHDLRFSQIDGCWTYFGRCDEGPPAHARSHG